MSLLSQNPTDAFFLCGKLPWGNCGVRKGNAVAGCSHKGKNQYLKTFTGTKISLRNLTAWQKNMEVGWLLQNSLVQQMTVLPSNLREGPTGGYIFIWKIGGETYWGAWNSAALPWGYLSPDDKVTISFRQVKICCGLCSYYREWGNISKIYYIKAGGKNS